MPRPQIAAVILAGGTARRFGADKLSAPWGQGTLLDHVLDSLPMPWEVVVVGPARQLRRDVRTVREVPPGGGPAAALLTGIQATGAARTVPASMVVTLPGDAPYAGAVARLLIEALSSADEEAAPPAVVAASASGPNPLHLALRGVPLTAARQADPGAWHNRSARALTAWLGVVPIMVDSTLLADVDTPADLQRLDVPFGTC